MTSNNLYGSFSEETQNVNLAEKEGLVLQSYDIDSEVLFQYVIPQNMLKSLEGMSQISMDNKLFLCGSSSANPEPVNPQESLPNVFTSSFMYSVNLLKSPLTLSFEVNSCFLHYYPTLSCLRNEYIIVLGGYRSKKCEYYSNTNKKWKELPDLPEERYGSMSVCDNTYNVIYCFGGYNSETKKNCMSIFKLNVNTGIKWETIIATENSELLAKQFSCIIKRDNGHVMILGGKNKKNQSCDEIVDIELSNKAIKVNPLTVPVLCQNLKFLSLRQGEENVNGWLYLFDDEGENNVYRVDSKFSSVIKLDK